MAKAITRELHAEVRESLKTMGVVTVAARHGLSRSTVRRIKEGGPSFAGYKEQLRLDHTPLFSVFREDEKFLEDKRLNNKGVFAKTLGRLKALKKSNK